ncbi:DNA polymerase III subunit beta [Streptomyces sp. BPTC-684]|uniref:DNA polymerase III subunit beta n=1 Tax=Streptomyces sp. BPTC-684 TaxID=3043734 RepID=UPI0024B0690F|nr:DNA polymerase III subunit beta [Streptomyces sp. BPTC-684]WHM41146.1 DNA polymerase III subunit beta [Streptomyces sp. BPTC-684]
MKLTIERDDLADATQWALRAIPSHPPVPVLAGILLDAQKKDTLGISGFNYYVSTRAAEQAETAEPGRVLVSGRLLADIVKALPKRPVLLAEDGTDLVLTCGKARFTLPTLPLEEYPALPKLPAASGTVDGGLFADLATRVAAAVDRDPAVPVLSGVQITYDAEHLLLGATDRYRFNVAELPWTAKAKIKPGKVLVPAEILKDAAKVLVAGEQATLAFTPNMFAVSVSDRHLTGGLIDGDLPKYQSLFPTEFATVATAATAELAAVVGRVSLVLAKNAPLFLDIADGEITVRAGTHDTGTGLDSLDATLEGDPLTIAFNPRLLTETLHGIAADRVQLNLTTPVKPALLHAPDQAATYRALLMPVRTTETTPKEE